MRFLIEVIISIAGFSNGVPIFRTSDGALIEITASRLPIAVDVALTARLRLSGNVAYWVSGYVMRMRLTFNCPFRVVMRIFFRAVRLAASTVSIVDMRRIFRYPEDSIRNGNVRSGRVALFCLRTVLVRMFLRDVGRYLTAEIEGVGGLV